jgi:glycine betaine/choline ABC-type transport system substrate-binding protein
MLADDQHAFPPYNACYVVRKELVEHHPEVEMALSMLSGHLTAETMRGLNRRVEIDHQRVEQVAKDYLSSQP